MQVLQTVTNRAEKKASSTDTSEDNPKILAFRRELEEIALNHLGKISKNSTTGTNSVNTGSKPVNTSSFDPNDSPMPELEIFHKFDTRIFDEGYYDERVILSSTWNEGDSYKVGLQKHKERKEVGCEDKARLGGLRVTHLKSAFLYDTIDEEVYVSQPLGFVDPDHPNKMSSMGELTFFLGLQVKQNKGGIFISQDKYVAEILKKFDLVNVKAAITPMETKVPLTKDEEAIVFVHVFRESPFDLEAFSDSDYGELTLQEKSKQRGCQFLGQRLISWQCKKQTIVATSTTEAEYVAAANCCGQVLWVQNQLLDYGFAEIVDFLRGSNLRYALTSNPTIYDSLVKQFWQTATTNTIADGTLEINATIDTIRYTITEASIRDTLQLADATGITMLPNDEIFEGMGQMGYPTDGTFTFWKSFFTPQWRYLVHHLLHCISSKSGGWDQFGSNIATALIYKVFDVSSFSANDFEYSNGKQTPLSGCEPDQKDLWEYEKGGQEHPDVAQSQPSSSKIPVPSTSSPPVQSPPPITAPIPETDPEPMEHTFEEPSPAHQHFLPPQEHVQGQMTFGKEGEEAGRDEAIRLAEAIRLDTLEKEEEALRNEDRDLILEKKGAELNAELSNECARKCFQGETLKEDGWDMEAISAEEFKSEKDLIARKGLHSDKTNEDESEASKDADPVSGTNISINPVPVAIKPPSIAIYKIIKQGKYRIVMNRYGMNGPEDELEKVLWEYLKYMFEEPLSIDPIWSLLGQQRIISWRYYNTYRVHCLNLESMDIYMLIERKYPLSTEVCKAMLDKKLQGGKPDEDCYKLLKMIEK
ncbi:putative ribonuclease H-like domain-containing protein [Tanacetum coccineum]|uniref:Ribonuclease H-like domain-containing protein n=1 Tax=Tanacetum coccineum TaxID=301880 RepID=A0ABQ5HJH2_9ASTR